MSLQDLYQRFLADPKPASLAPDASLLYITTTTKFDQADAVISHLQKQRNVVKKSESVINAIESAHSLCLDVETTLEFVSGGGAYLPSLDDNFLADRVATFPAIHIIQFNAQRQIQQIRLYWDQASLLKQIEVIGARSRNWPIRDAKDQTRMIKSAVVSEPADNAPASSASPLPSNTDKELDDAQRPSSPTKKRIKDPYAAESLFDLLSPGGKDRNEPVHAPRSRANAQPAPRDYGELFVSHDNDTPDASPSKQAAPKAGAGKNYQQSRIFNDEDPTDTPSKAVAPKRGSNHSYKPSRIFDHEEPSATSNIAPKGGSSHNYKPSRIFDDDETVAAENAQTPKYRTNPNKYSHFEIGGDNSAREAPIPTRPKSQHMSQWNFEDFNTPEKPVRKPRGQEIRHFGWSDDEGEVQDSPPAKPRVPKPRRDAESHFELTDDMDTPKEARMIGSHHNRGLKLYQNPLATEEEEELAERTSKRPVSMVGNGVNRKKDFDSHWSMTDSPERNANGNGNAENRKPLGHDRMKAVRMMESSWESYDESPVSKPVQPKAQRVSRDVNQRSWGFGDE